MSGGAPETGLAFGGCFYGQQKRSFTDEKPQPTLPDNLAAVDGLQGLKYVKAKDKVLSVRPSTGIVDEIAM